MKTQALALNGDVDQVKVSHKYNPDPAYHFIIDLQPESFEDLQIPQKKKIADARRFAAKLYETDDNALPSLGEMKRIQQFATVCKYLLATAYGAHLHAFNSSVCADYMQKIYAVLNDEKFVSHELVIGPLSPSVDDKQFSIAELERQRCRRLMCNTVAHFALLPDGVVEKKQ